MPVSLSKEQLRLRASAAAFTRWSREDPRPAMTKVRAARMAKYEAKIDPEGRLPEAERLRRATALFNADMKLLALRSSRARAKARRQAAS